MVVLEKLLATQIMKKLAASSEMKAVHHRVYKIQLWIIS
jgi:hypothetical protein